MSKDVLRTAILINGNDARTTVDFTPVSTALHQNGINVVPYSLGPNGYEAEYLHGLVTTIDDLSYRAGTTPALTVVTAGPLATDVALEVAARRNISAVAALAPNLGDYHMDEIQRLKGDGLHIVVFQPREEDARIAADQTLGAVLNNDFHNLRRAQSLNRMPLTDQIITGIAAIAQRAPARRGNPLPSSPRR